MPWWLGLLALALAAPPLDDEVHWLVPGFEARRVPVPLTNVNNLAHGPDGRLYALLYDGRVLRLLDTDGDGLEDRAEPFWDRTTLHVPVGMVWGPEGLFVAAHGKVVLLRDADGDGTAETEEVVASGWPPTDVPSGGVDALGVTRDRDGNLYFHLGTPNYSNPYRLDDGQARYDLRGERGAILRLSADRSRREIVATGVRFAYALRFNRHGDLFATDQEGATWLPGGNPLDELNHIQPGRHYGFPPRHERYLPDVVDEPPVVGFGPQHQSTCGLAFNEPEDGGRTFGPSSWEGDALVAGFARGRLYRVQVVKTPTGYVGREATIAVLPMLTADVVLGRSGALTLACHSGLPDWGTGPTGPGALYRLTYIDSSAPQPVAAWPAGPLEVRVAFDRPIAAAVLDAVVGRTIVVGEHVRAGDRYERFQPPYNVVAEQRAAPRGSIRIVAARLEDAGRTLVLSTDPHPGTGSHALTIPEVRAAGGAQAGTAVELTYTLQGVEARWEQTESDKSFPPWSGWWPHLDTDVLRSWTAGSAAHETLRDRLRRSGRVTLRGLVALPAGRSVLRLTTTGRIEEAALAHELAEPTDDGRRVELATESTGTPVDLFLTIVTAGKPFELRVSYHTERDPTQRPLPAARLLLPWASAVSPAPSGTAPPLPAALAGGDPGQGEAVFFSPEARCAHCHTFRGRGSAVGPDLSNLWQRDRESIHRDLAEPSAAIHPDYVPYTISLRDGRVLAGIVRADGPNDLRIVDSEARTTVVPRDAIDEFRPTATSIMPVGLVGVLGESKLRDLLAFLTAPPPGE